MQKRKEADQPKTHPSSGSVISMSGVISAVCAALMLVMFLLAFFSEIVGRGWATHLFVAPVEFRRICHRWGHSYCAREPDACGRGTL